MCVFVLQQYILKHCEQSAYNTAIPLFNSLLTGFKYQRINAIQNILSQNGGCF